MSAKVNYRDSVSNSGRDTSTDDIYKYPAPVLNCFLSIGEDRSAKVVQTEV